MWATVKYISTSKWLQSQKAHWRDYMSHSAQTILQWPQNDHVGSTRKCTRKMAEKWGKGDIFCWDKIIVEAGLRFSGETGRAVVLWWVSNLQLKTESRCPDYRVGTIEFFKKIVLGRTEGHCRMVLYHEKLNVTKDTVYFSTNKPFTVQKWNIMQMLT